MNWLKLKLRGIVRYFWDFWKREEKWWQENCYNKPDDYIW